MKVRHWRIFVLGGCVSALALACSASLAGACAGISSSSVAAGRYIFPPVEQLADNANMPDPFKKPDGSRVSNLAEWPQQREYLKAMLQHYLYGHLPPKPAGAELTFERTLDESYSPTNTTIQGRKQRYRITISRNGLTHSFGFNLWRPADSKRYPTLINNFPEHSKAAALFSMAEGVRRGYLVAEYDRTEIAPDDPKNTDRHAGIFRLYPEYDFYTIGAWAWAYQPVIDVLDQLGLADMKKIIVTGHSRGGFTAMAGAIFDDRVAIAAPSAAGPFANGSIRQRDSANSRGTTDYVEFLQGTFPHWFHPRYYEFLGRQNKFPWDVPTLSALVAPRPLLVLSSAGDGYDNWLGQEIGTRAGTMIYDWFGVGQWCRIHWRDVENRFGQKGHDEGPEEFLAIFDYADEFFLGKKPNPTRYNVMPGFEAWRYAPAKYPLQIDWTVPNTR